MNSLWQSSVAVLAVLTWLAAPPRTLADAAQREAFRRNTTPRARVVLTNLGLPPESLVAATAPPATSADAPTPPPAAAEKGETKDEGWWRKRIATARETLAKDQANADALQTRINTLERDVVNRDNPLQQAKLREELQRALADLDTARKQVVGDRKAIEGIQDEARRLDVPAGWVR